MGLTLVDVVVRVARMLLHLLDLPLLGVPLLSFLAELVRLRLQTLLIVDCGNSRSAPAHIGDRPHSV